MLEDKYFRREKESSYRKCSSILSLSWVVKDLCVCHFAREKMCMCWYLKDVYWTLWIDGRTFFFKNFDLILIIFLVLDLSVVLMMISKILSRKEKKWNHGDIIATSVHLTPPAKKKQNTKMENEFKVGPVRFKVLVADLGEEQGMPVQISPEVYFKIFWAALFIHCCWLAV